MMEIENVKLGSITQGTIFNGAIADRYPDKRVYGLTITARCDIFNDKFPVLNYLPIVRLHDWVHCDGIDILYRIVQKDEENRFRSFLNKEKIDESVLLANSRKKVTEEYCKAKDKTEMLKLCDKLEILDNFEPSNAEKCNWLIKNYLRQMKGILKELMNLKYQHYYFIPKIDGNEGGEGFVVLMRESAFIPRLIANELAWGIDFSSSNFPSKQLEKYFCMKIESLVKPIGQISSPYIEHIMQSFATMFTRIGLENYETSFIEEIVNQDFLLEQEV